MGMGRVMDMKGYFEANPTVERINGPFELFDCTGVFLCLLGQEKYRLGPGYDYDRLVGDSRKAGYRVDDLAELALGGMICYRLGFVERIDPQVPGVDPDEAEVYRVTDAGAEWFRQYDATYPSRFSAWLDENDARNFKGTEAPCRTIGLAMVTPVMVAEAAVAAGWPPIMTLEEAAQAMRISPQTLRRYVSEGKYKKSVKRGWPVLFWRDTLLAEFMKGAAR